jgi:hypothetical protein
MHHVADRDEERGTQRKQGGDVGLGHETPFG